MAAWSRAGSAGGGAASVLGGRIDRDPGRVPATAEAYDGPRRVLDALGPHPPAVLELATEMAPAGWRPRGRPNSALADHPRARLEHVMDGGG